MKVLAEHNRPLVGGLVLLYCCITVQMIQGLSTTNETGTIVAVPSDAHERSKRTLVYTFNSCSGILIALSIPLLVTGRNIFFSYNFEANYNMPTDSTDFTQGILKKGDNDQIDESAARQLRSVDRNPPDQRSMQPSVPQKRSSITRKKVYRMIELNLERYGYAGKRCILRMICDLAQDPMHHENGVFGDLLQLLFTPSLSKDEQLPGEFERAERLGLEQRNCTKYQAHCPSNPIDLVSVVLGGQ
ncbi:uncharacterized protein LOC118456695 [Anopheles albimanus]|uniref:uncharacterized protein LOC118456695 n=1 Tax=Anopheles albimanus TaxID=7167 RepID=UPI00163EC382|nr:uncharacterized protein LOC118456695 [Anopheles albimanus]